MSEDELRDQINWKLACADYWAHVGDFETSAKRYFEALDLMRELEKEAPP